MITMCTVLPPARLPTSEPTRRASAAARDGPTYADARAVIDLCLQAVAGGPPRPQRQAARDVAPQTDRAACLRVGPDVLRGLRARGDPADAVGRRAGGIRILAVDRARRRGGAARGR